VNVLNVFEIEAFAFLLILARMSSFLIAWPLLGGMNVPGIIKVLLSLMLSLVLFPMIKDSMVVSIVSWQQLIFFVGKEVVIGLVLAHISYFFFYAVQAGSELMSLSLGISSAQMFNPTMDTQATPVDNIYYSMAALFFLMINGHHIFLTGLVQSYDVIPAYRWGLEAKNFTEIALVAKDVLSLGLQLAAPVLVSILLINITLAIVGRAVPQINVLVTSLPVNILVGLAIMIVATPFVLSQFGDGMEVLMAHFFKILKSI